MRLKLCLTQLRSFFLITFVASSYGFREIVYHQGLGSDNAAMQFMHFSNRLKRQKLHLGRKVKMQHRKGAQHKGIPL